MQTTRLCVSLEGLNSSPVHCAGALCWCKVAHAVGKGLHRKIP